MKSQRIVLVILVSVVVLALLAACTGGSLAKPSTGGSGSGGKNYNITATEFEFKPNQYEAKVGQKVTFKVTNKGTVEHTFVILSPDGSQELAKISTQPGETKPLEFTPTEAVTYQIVCNIAGHKETGMTGTFTVK